MGDRYSSWQWHCVYRPQSPSKQTVRLSAMCCTTITSPTTATGLLERSASRQTQQQFGTDRNATCRQCRASPLKGKQRVGTSGDSRPSCGRQTVCNTLERRRTVTATPLAHIFSRNVRKPTFSFNTKRLHDKQISRNFGADGRKLRCVNCARQSEVQ